MKGALSLRASVIVLALSCVVAAQAISFLILLTFPAPAPPAMTPSEVSTAIHKPQTASGAGLESQVVGRPPFVQDRKGYTQMVVASLRFLLADMSVRDIRVLSLSDSVSLHSDGAPPVAVMAHAVGSDQSDEDLATAPFPSFAAAVQLIDGRWLLVQPRRALVSPEHLRIAAAFGLSILLLAPLTWWSARRLTRPLQVLAGASQALGRNPSAPPLPVGGPREVREASSAFNAMQTDLGRHMDERITLVAAIAHDLRTPLTSLRLRAESAPATERARMAADIARMEALIADMLLFVRGGRVASHHDLVDLADLAQEVASEAKASGGQVCLIHSDRTFVLANFNALRRAVENIVQNAVAYAGAATLSVGSGNNQAWIEVVDDGPGISSDALEMVFEPFVRLERSRSRDTGGVGLGLAIARNIARAHGGDVQLIRREPRGMIARLVLPRADAAAAHDAKLASAR